MGRWRTPTDSSGSSDPDPGSFTHVFKNTGYFTITASTADGSFTGTQDVQVTGGAGGFITVVSAPNSDGNQSGLADAVAGVPYSLTATYTDPNGHHVREWYINWGDGNSQTFGSVTSTTDPSDSSAPDPTTAHPLQSTDTITFTHTYSADFITPNPIDIEAVTAESFYTYLGGFQVTQLNNIHAEDDLAVAYLSTVGGHLGDIVDGTPEAALDISAPPGTLTVDWGDGTPVDTYIDSGPDVLTASTPDGGHDYRVAGEYIATITDQVDDPTTFPGVWIAHIGMDAVPNEGQGMLPTTINPIVAAAGQGIGTTLPLNVGDSEDPFFATIDWGDGTGPHIVPVVNGAVDLSNLVAPTHMTDAERENGFGATITVANGNDYFYDVIHPIDDMSTGTLQVYVWSITIGDGGNDDVLVPTDPADDSLPVTLNLPHPTGLAYDMTLSLNYDTDYGPTGVQLWSADGTTLLLADGSSSMGIQTTPDQTGENYEITGMDDAPAEADVVADYFTLTDITVDTSRSTTQPAAGEQATPKEPVYSNVAHVLDAKLGVSTVDDGNPSGFLSQADKAATGPGAFVPLDNNDWDYLNGTDMDQSGSVVGDKYLLKVIIPAAADAQPGDYYTLSTGGSIRIYTHSDRTGLVLMSNGALPPGYVANKFLANVAHCVYIEGIRDTTTTSPTTLFLNAVVGGVSHTHIDSCKITVFTIIGPLDVPGNGTYSYDVDLSNGPMLAPTGGAR